MFFNQIIERENDYRPSSEVQVGEVFFIWQPLEFEWGTDFDITERKYE